MANKTRKNGSSGGLGMDGGLDAGQACRWRSSSVLTAVRKGVILAPMSEHDANPASASTAVREDSPAPVAPPDKSSNKRVKWKADPSVGRTVIDDSFCDWDDAIYEIIKNSIAAKATAIYITSPTHEMATGAERVVTITDNGIGMSAAEVETLFCTIGRPITSGRNPFQDRGTGRLAMFAVANLLKLETWQTGKKSSVTLTRTLARGESPDSSHEADLVEEPACETTATGTRLSLSEFLPGQAPPTALSIGRSILRRFGAVDKISIYVNGEIYKPADYAAVVSKIDENIDGVGQVSGAIWIMKDHPKDGSWHPGVVITSHGQTFYGPSLFDQNPAESSGVTKRTQRSIVGSLEIPSLRDEPRPPSNWPGGKPIYDNLHAWISKKLQTVINDNVKSHIDEKVNLWISDERARRIYATLDDAKRASARNILSKIAEKRISDSGEVKVIARLVLRCLSTSSLTTILDSLEIAHDRDLDTFAKILSGTDKWSIRQIADAASMMKHRSQTLDDLEKSAADYTKNEDAMHRILESNPWIIAEQFVTFRSNKMIRTTLREVFGIESDVPSASRKPDFFFILGDPTGTTTHAEIPRYLFVELKGPDQPLNREKHDQATRDATTFLAEKDGYAHVVLIGTKFDAKPRFDKDYRTGTYSFESMTYDDLISKARARLGYIKSMSDGDEERLVTKAHELMEAEVSELVGIATDTVGSTPELPVAPAST